MTEVFQIILAILQVIGVMAFAVGMTILHRWVGILKEKREDVMREQERLKETLAAMNKFHNDNIEHKKAVDKQLKEQAAQLSSLTQLQAGGKPSFMR